MVPAKAAAVEADAELGHILVPNLVLMTAKAGASALAMVGPRRMGVDVDNDSLGDGSGADIKHLGDHHEIAVSYGTGSGSGEQWGYGWGNGGTASGSGHGDNYERGGDCLSLSYWPKHKRRFYG